MQYKMKVANSVYILIMQSKTYSSSSMCYILNSLKQFLDYWYIFLSEVYEYSSTSINDSKTLRILKKNHYSKQTEGFL